MARWEPGLVAGEEEEQQQQQQQGEEGEGAAEERGVAGGMPTAAAAAAGAAAGEAGVREVELPRARNVRVRSAEFVKSSVSVEDCPPARFPEFAGGWGGVEGCLGGEQACEGLWLHLNLSTPSLCPSHRAL